jgi:endonuclease/exonuclease/phosphatase family metal-dependent hydrolase
MEIITFNIWDLPLWFVRNRKKRMLDIAEYFTARGTDILCFQESWSAQHRAILSACLQKNGYHAAITDTTKHIPHGGLVLFSKFPILSTRFIKFGRWGVSISEIIGNKGALEVVMETPAGVVRVVNLHLHHQSSRLFKTAAIRIRQLQTMFTVLEKDQGIPTIIVGDFNQHDMFQSNVFAELFARHGFTHHPEIASDQPTYRVENYFVDNWLNRITVSQRYDYIVTKHIERLGYGTISYGPLYTTPELSDHDPVSLRLS